MIGLILYSPLDVAILLFLIETERQRERERERERFFKFTVKTS